MTIFSIGHSTHTPEQFAPIARGLDVIIDIRSHPTSHWDWWWQENMSRWLPAAGFDLIWLPELGGWGAEDLPLAATMAEVGVDLGAYSKGAFPKQRIGVDRRDTQSDGPSWTNQGLYDYGWYTATNKFWSGLRWLIDRYAAPDQPRAAVLCSEAVYWKCHRSMVADVLYASGVDLLHIKPFAPKRPTTERWIHHGGKIGNRLERYPDRVLRAWGDPAERLGEWLGASPVCWSHEAPAAT